MADKRETKLIDNLQTCLDKKILQVYRLAEEMKSYAVLTKEGEGTKTFPLHSKDFSLTLRAFYKCRFNEYLTDAEAKDIISYLEVIAYENTLSYELSNRIYTDDEQIIYDLNSNGDVVWVIGGEYSISRSDDLIFKRNQFYRDQIEPKLEQKPEDLLRHVRRHFILKDEGQVKLLALYLASCFCGNSIQHPILYLQGDMGSSKSTSLRKIEKLVDPKNTDLLGIPKGMDGVELRLADSYFVALDNISKISKSLSDILCRAVTGGSVTKRMLYENTREISMKIKALIGITSISMVFSDADILDRTLILNLQRLGEDIETEQVIWNKFNRDLPYMLGCCFACVAKALEDKNPIKVINNEKIRLYDWEECCIKIGRVLGISDQETAELLLMNKHRVNRETLNESIVAQCLIKFMDGKPSHSSSVEELLNELKKIANENAISEYLLPKTPNHLSRKLNQVQPCLEFEAGISYFIQNVGSFRKITIEKNSTRIIDNIASQKKKPLKKIDRIKKNHK